MNGPYETEREARAAAHAIVPPDDGWSILHTPQNRLLLERACKAAGVELGAYDRRILDWLAGFEDSICAVVAGLISRAHETDTKARVHEGNCPAGTFRFRNADDGEIYAAHPDGTAHPVNGEA